MDLNEAISILNKNNYKVKSLNEADLRFDSADQFLSFTQAKGYYQNSVKIANINTMLSEKELNNTGSDIGEVIIEHYCKKFDTSKKELQKAWDKGWKAEDPDAFKEDDFDEKKCKLEECVQVFQKAAIMHAFLNNF